MTTLTDSITQNIAHSDLSRRFVCSTTVVASPADATEVIVASITLPANLTIVSGIILLGFAAFTVGTNGISANLKLHHTNLVGATVAATGPVTEVATHLDDLTVVGFDLVPTLPNQTYVLSLTMGSASAASAVSAVGLVAIAV